MAFVEFEGLQTYEAGDDRATAYSGGVVSEGLGMRRDGTRVVGLGFWADGAGVSAVFFFGGSVEVCVEKIH